MYTDERCHRIYRNCCYLCCVCSHTNIYNTIRNGWCSRAISIKVKGTMMDRESYNSYQRIYQLKRYHARRDEAINILGGKCVFCAATENLEIDHIEKHEKSINLSGLWSIPKVRFYKELEKCQALCKTCHKGKTSIENSVNHGEGLTGKKNCYCLKCRPLKREYTYEHRRLYGRKRGTVS